MAAPQISKQAVKNELWRRGMIQYKMKPNQVEMYNIYLNSPSNSTLVWLLARQSGKSYCLGIIAVIECLSKPNVIVKLLTDTRIHAKTIFTPIFREIFEDCPDDMKPEYIKSDSVYIFTPKGRIIELPRGTTAVDFAYAIHTDVGNRCVGARIDRRLAPLGTLLTSGQTVEIINAPGARPDPAWLNFAVTAKARSNIRHYLKNLKTSEAISLGKRLLVRELKLLAVNYDDIDPARLQKILTEYHLENEQALFQETGLGNRIARLIARQLIEVQDTEKKKVRTDRKESHPLIIRGTEGMVVNFPKCCLPIPGDKILGFVSTGRGIVVHHQSCPNVTEFRNHPEKWINVQWESGIEGSFQTNILIEVTNQRGVLAKLASAISMEEANIVHVEMKDRDDRYTSLKFVIEVRDRIHLARIMRRVRNINNVARISRR